MKSILIAVLLVGAQAFACGPEDGGCAVLPAPATGRSHAEFRTEPKLHVALTVSGDSARLLWDLLAVLEYREPGIPNLVYVKKGRDLICRESAIPAPPAGGKDYRCELFLTPRGEASAEAP